MKSLFEGCGDMLLDFGYFFGEVRAEVVKGLELYFVDDGGEDVNEVFVALD